MMVAPPLYSSIPPPNFPSSPSSSSCSLVSSSSSSFPSSSSVVVAVRVRPFTEYEKVRNAKLVVKMSGDGRTTELRDPNGPNQHQQNSHRFIFDHSFWSHDGYRVMDDGYLAPNKDGIYADQKRLFDDLGHQVLKNAWTGYNCTLFAYGQTGSGKSYSIIGFGPNRGIVPQLCDHLFKGIAKEKEKQPNADFQVSISMLEIYCEKVRDLLGEKRARLKVREHPRDGFYVEGLSNWPVDGYRDVEKKIMQGTRMRTIAATNMNETSSRAHTIVRLHFQQKSPKGLIKASQINLVDLAGSERQKKGATSNGRGRSNGAEGKASAERQKEGIRINLSLSTLGRVIQALHERQQQQQQQQQQMGGNNTINMNGLRGPNIMAMGGVESTSSLPSSSLAIAIPYRDSVLTTLLRNALGGNSKTIMIAAISPADMDYEETLSTLRFADRVKQIKTRPVVNETKTEKLVKALREENERLVEMLRKEGTLEGVASQDELEALRRQLAENQREMERLERNWTQREEALKKQLNSLSIKGKRGGEKEEEEEEEEEEERNEKRRKEETPFFWNLNEDPALTNVIVHFVEKGESRVGNGTAAKKQERKRQQIVMKGLSIQPEHAILRNIDNRKVTLIPQEGTEILLNGRPIIGETELNQNDRVHFGGNHLYVFVNPHKKAAQFPMDKISFEMAQKEIAREGHLMVGGRKTNEELIIEEELVNLLPYVYRANSMAKELGKNVTYEIVLLPPESRGGGGSSGRGMAADDDGGSMTEIWVKVENRNEESTHLWDSNRFMSRYYGMQEIYHNYLENGEDRQSLASMENEKDPFQEDVNCIMPLGTSTVFLQNLAYLVEIDERIPIIDLQGGEVGHLSISMRPCSTSGREIVGEYVERSEHLVGKNLGIKVKLLSAFGLPRRIEQSCCKFRFFDQQPVSSPFQIGQNPVYAHEQFFLFRPVTQQLVDYLTESALVIEVFAIQQSRLTTSKIAVPETTTTKKANYSSSNKEKERIMQRKERNNNNERAIGESSVKGSMGKRRTNSVIMRKTNDNANNLIRQRMRYSMDTEANRLKYQTDSQATFGEGTTTKRIIAERTDEVKSKK